MNQLKKISLIVMVCFMYAHTFAQRFITPTFQRADLTITNNVVFGRNFDFLTDPAGIERDQRMRVYQPSQSVDTLSERPVFIYLHTGNFLPAGFNSPNGGIDDSLVVEMSKQWAERGFVVVTPSYRLGWNPQAPDEEVRRSSLLRAVYRGIVDAKTVVRFLRKSYFEDGNPYRIDPDRIVLFGEGTGGYLSLAYGALSNFQELLQPKFTDFTVTPPAPYVDTLEAGNIEGIGGSKNVSNHPSYSSKVNLIMNAGGALADNSWVNEGEVPVISFQCVRDPFAPYGAGTVFVPVNPPQVVVDVVGAGVYQATVNSFGNNCAFDNVADFTDPYSVRARSLYNTVVDYIEAGTPTINVGSGEGLFPFILPIDNTDKFKNQAGPWQWWDSSHPKNTEGLNSNPDMSKAKALAYVDTIQGYGLPRVYKVLNLGDLSAEPNNCGSTSVFNSVKNKGAVKMYPNPSTGRLFVELKNTDLSISKVQIFDLAGKVVLAETVTNINNIHQLNASRLDAGVYFVNVVLSNGEQLTNKVIFE
jgi:hypothetical protein